MPIVVGYVPTPEGRAAVVRAAHEATLRHVDLIVVQPQPPVVGAPEQASADEDEEVTQALAAAREAGVRHEARTAGEREELSDHLISVAEETAADFIVIGLRRRSKVGKLILGSNAQRILLDAGCPVLAVKAPEGP